jgi:hypothetical protein
MAFSFFSGRRSCGSETMKFSAPVGRREGLGKLPIALAVGPPPHPSPARGEGGAHVGNPLFLLHAERQPIPLKREFRPFCSGPRGGLRPVSLPPCGGRMGWGESSSHVRTGTRSWHPPLREPCGATRPTPSSGSGRGSASASSTVTGFGGKFPWVLTSSTSHVSRRAWSSRSTAGSMAGELRRMGHGRCGSRRADFGSCAFGTTRCSATWMGCWRRSDELCRIEPRIDPPPHPSPARGEGVLLMPSLWGQLKIAPWTDRPRLRFRSGKERIAADSASLPPCGGGSGWGESVLPSSSWKGEEEGRR